MLFAFPACADKIMKCKHDNHIIYFKLEENWFSKNKFFVNYSDGVWQPFCHINQPNTKSVDFQNLENENLYQEKGKEINPFDKYTPKGTDPEALKYKYFYQYMDEVAICDIQQDDDSRNRQIIDFETVSHNMIGCYGSPLINHCDFDYDYPINFDCKIQD